MRENCSQELEARALAQFGRVGKAVAPGPGLIRLCSLRSREVFGDGHATRHGTGYLIPPNRAPESRGS